MKINWKVRLKNKNFWLSLIPACLLLLSVILPIFGVDFELTELEYKIETAIQAIFTILSILGIVVDPTTKGVSDSERAMTYDKPN